MDGRSSVRHHFCSSALSSDGGMFPASERPFRSPTIRLPYSEESTNAGGMLDAVLCALFRIHDYSVHRGLNNASSLLSEVYEHGTNILYEYAKV